MKRSTDRFLTTHTGSLPRPDDLVRAMFAREEGVPIDGAAVYPGAQGIPKVLPVPWSPPRIVSRLWLGGV